MTRSRPLATRPAKLLVVAAVSLSAVACGQRLEPVAVASDPELRAEAVLEVATTAAHPTPASTPTPGPTPEPTPTATSAPQVEETPSDPPREPRASGWAAIPPPPFAASFSHTAWTGEELILVGGARIEGGLHREAAAYDPVRMSWRSLSPVPHEAWGYWGRAHWTGREVIIFGLDHSSGDPGSSPRLAYDPSADRWRELPATPLRDVTGATSFWTGRELLVLATPRSGGAPVGAAYDPARDRWRTIAAFPVGGDRYGPGTVWTGQELLVWGGQRAQAYPAVGGQEPPPPADGGAAYDPARDEWRVLDVATEALGLAPTAWTGREILALAHDDPLQVHAISADLGSVRQMADAPSGAMRGENPVWTGSELVLIGGRSDDHDRGGVAFDPRADRWHELPDPGFGAERAQVIAWAGSELVVVGGRSTVVMETERAEGDAFSWRP